MTVEIAITAAELPMFIPSYVVFARLFPLVSIWDVKEAPDEAKLGSGGVLV